MSGAAEHRVRIVAYRPEHRAAVRDLNIAWLQRHFSVEPRDERELGDPAAYILAKGGEIFMAELDGRVVGTCSLLREDNGAYELAKMAVDESARGRGVGRALAAAVIARARAKGIGQLELFTNSLLVPAVQLYRSLGFVDAPLHDSVYGRANMRMVLDVSAPVQVAR